MSLDFNFRSASLLFIALFVSSALLTSCDQENTDNEPQETAAPTEDDAVDALAGALQEDTEGLAAEAISVAELADDYLEKSGGNPCEETYDSTFTRPINNSWATGEYVVNWEWTLECNDVNIPEILNLIQTSAGQYESLRLLSDDTGMSEWSVANIVGGTDYVINGSYERTGTMESKVRNRSTFSSVLTLDVEDLLVGKESKEIQSGLADIILSLTGPNGTTQIYTGTLVFEGNGTVTVVISGNSYTIDLNV